MIVTLDHDVYDSEGNLLLAKGYAVDLSEENRDRLGRLGIRQEENQPQANGQKQNVEEYGINTLRSAPSKTPEGPKIVLNSFVAKLIENKLSLEQAWFQEA